MRTTPLTTDTSTALPATGGGAAAPPPARPKICTREQHPRKSSTYTSPVRGETNRPDGEVNCPSPVPRLPHFVRNAPSRPNFCTRVFPVSETYTPVASAAMPIAPESRPSPVPGEPQAASRAPDGLNFCTRPRSRSTV